MDNDKFTAREVAVLVEDLRGEFRTVSEVVVPLREDMAEVKERLSGVEERLSLVENRLSGVEGALKLTLPDFRNRISRLETRVGS